MKYTQESIPFYCSEGGDPSDDCKDCVYGVEYHCVDGECVRRSFDPSEAFLQPPEEVCRK